MPDTLKSALIGFHTFSGNDYISSIFRKSKRILWKKMEKSKSFSKIFAKLGNQWITDGALQPLLEEYVFFLFMVGKMISTKCVIQLSKIYTRRKAGLRIFPCCYHAVEIKPKEPKMQLHCRSVEVKSSVHYSL